MSNLTHIDKENNAKMIDITNKKQTIRKAIAQGFVFISPETLQAITNNSIRKGNVFETARIAGIIAAKKTSILIPMCHQLNLTHIQINFFPNHVENFIRIESSVKTLNSTGVEMEALTAVSISGLTIYDMCKSDDKNITISNIHLLKKYGGKSNI